MTIIQNNNLFADGISQEQASHIPENDYLLLTPGPLSTSKTVRAAMQKDLCTWDNDYKSLVTDIRAMLKVLLFNNDTQELYTTVLMQGSGTFVVESTIGSLIAPHHKLLILSNGIYGDRIHHIAKYYNINAICHKVNETKTINADEVANILKNDPAITHVAIVHCETTTGALNDLTQLANVIKNQYHKIFIVDAMSSLGGIPIDIVNLDIDAIISSANKCIQGVPGFGFVIVKKQLLESCKGYARSLSLDLYDQYLTMELDQGKWRFTSPTHVVRAFYQALIELNQEGGVTKRYLRYRENHRILVEGMHKLGFKTLIDANQMSVIITSFLYPSSEFNFNDFYYKIKQQGFVLYPGKVTNCETFRIGTIGHIFPEDMHRLVKVIANVSENK